MEKKTYFIVLVVSLFLLLVIILYPSNDESVEPIKKEIIKQSQVKEKKTTEVIYTNSIEEEEVESIKEIVTQKLIIQEENGFVQNIRISDIADIYNLKVENKTITLFSTIDNKNRYSISLKSSKKITSALPKSKYIIINGMIEEDGIQSKFSLSFNEFYKEYSYHSYLEITNKESNTTARCDGSFLGAISPEYRYRITLNVYGEVLSCYMNSQEENTDKNENKFTKEFNIINTKLPTIEEKTVNQFFKSTQPKGALDGDIH